MNTLTPTPHARRRWRERFGFSLNRNALAIIVARVRHGHANFRPLATATARLREVWVLNVFGVRACVVCEEASRPGDDWKLVTAWKSRNQAPAKAGRRAA